MTSSYMFNISIAGFNTGGGNVNFKGFANHVYRLPHGSEQYSLVPSRLFAPPLHTFANGGRKVGWERDYGQYGYRGHVTNLLQDIASFANSSVTFTILAKARPTMPCICLVNCKIQTCTCMGVAAILSVGDTGQYVLLAQCG